MDHIPTGILRIIVREATSIPDGLFYPVDGATTTTELLLERISDTMRTKCSISLVSKRFHDIGVEFLYNTIRIREPEKIRPLVLLLRQPSQDRVARGWWCRRVILDLNWHYIDWRHGSITLWGLLSSCPRLQYLKCHVRQTRTAQTRQSRFPWIPPSFPVPAVMLRTLATVQGRSLRSLHFGPHVVITKELALAVLPHLTALEVCRFEGLDAPAPYTPIHQVYGPRIPEGASIVVFSGTLPHYDESIEPTEAQEYDNAQKTATWPSFTDQIMLPRLRSFQCNSFFPEIGQWHLPALTEVIVGLENLYGETTCLRVLQDALYPFSEHITHLTFAGSMDIGPWKVLPIVPFVRQARFDLFSAWRGIMEAPHSSLTTIILKADHSSASDLFKALEGLQTNISHGTLPSLSTIMIEAHESDREELYDKEITAAESAIEKLHVQLGIAFVPEEDHDL